MLDQPGVTAAIVGASRPEQLQETLVAPTITLDPAKTRELLAWYRQGNFIWHIDGATEELPQRATLLSAREIDDDDGGDTEFASTYAAYGTHGSTAPAAISATCRRGPASRRASSNSAGTQNRP